MTSIPKLIQNIEDLIKKIDIRVRGEDFKDLDNTNRNVNELKILLNAATKYIDEIDNEMTNINPEKQKEYNFRVKTIRGDYENRKKNVLKIEEKYNSECRMKNLMSTKGVGMLKEEVKLAEREALLGLHQKTDYQGELINSIGTDIITAHNNLTGIVTEVKVQGDQINRIQQNVGETNTSVKRTDKTINVMQRRAVCMKVLLHILAVALFIAIIAGIVFKLSTK